MFSRMLLEKSLVVAAGSAIGGVLRFWIFLLLPRESTAAFPWETLTVNISGAFVIGVAAATLSSDTARIFVMAGLCGGFTTFSAFSLQTFELLGAGRAGLALTYIVTSVAVCLGACVLGWQLAGGVRAG